MNPGDLIYADRQAELAGLLIGEGTRFQVEGWDLFAAPNLTTKDTDRNDQGVLPGADLYAGRLVSIDVWLDAHPDMVQVQQDRATLEAAFGPGADKELHFRLDDVVYCYLGRGRGTTATLPSLEVWPVECRFLATDPRVFSSTVHRHTFDGSPATLVNAGTRATPWTWTVAGPCIGPRLWRTDDPDAFQWRFPDLELADGQVLTVDSRTGMAVVNGTSVIGQARDQSESRLPFPFEFPAGSVEWSMDADGDDGFPLSVLSWRDAWA